MFEVLGNQKAILYPFLHAWAMKSTSINLFAINPYDYSRSHTMSKYFANWKSHSSGTFMSSTGTCSIRRTDCPSDCLKIWSTTECTLLQPLISCIQNAANWGGADESHSAALKAALRLQNARKGASYIFSADFCLVRIALDIYRKSNRLESILQVDYPRLWSLLYQPRQHLPTWSWTWAEC